MQASQYQQQLSNLTLMVGFIHAHKHAQHVLQKHIQVGGLLGATALLDCFLSS